MSEQEKKILNEFLSKTLKIDDEQIAGLYNEAGELNSLQVGAEAIAQLVGQHRKVNTDQFNRGLKEGASKIEKEIRSKYEFESELQGVELVDAIVLSKIDETKGATKDISKHPEMIRARSEWEKELKKHDAEWQEKLEAKDKEFERGKLLEKVKTKGLAMLEELRPILPGDANKAMQWKQTFLNDLTSVNFQEVADDFVVLDREGKPMEDPYGRQRKFKEFHREVADKYFEFHKAEDRSSSGNKDSATGASMPRDEDEAYKELKDINITPERRIEITNFLKGKK